MEILETIPCYTTTIGLDIVIGAGVLLVIIALCTGGDWDWAPLAGVGGVLILLICLGLYNLGVGKTYSHDEYAVELKDMSAAEFYAQYEVVKQYEYSNVWRVKKK